MLYLYMHWLHAFKLTAIWLVLFLHSQTTIFSFILDREKTGSGTLMMQFLFSLPPSLGWVMIGDNDGFLRRSAALPKAATVKLVYCLILADFSRYKKLSLSPIINYLNWMEG